MKVLLKMVEGEGALPRSATVKETEKEVSHVYSRVEGGRKARVSLTVLLSCQMQQRALTGRVSGTHQWSRSMEQGVLDEAA